MTYNIDNQALIALTLSCLAAATAIAILIIYARRIILVVRNARRQADDTNQVFGLSPASIIVYAYENPDGVAALLPSLLSQDYDGGFEVIVVNDGNDEATDSLLRELEATHKNLYHTFTPHDTRNVSRKKLAITLGIKAARYESIVLVTADSRITSQRWLEKMARHFNDNEKDIVIGYAFPDLDNVANTPSRAEVQDWLIDIVHYLAAALDGHTYRGDGDNLAYRRSLFFKNKGFSQSLNLSYGDDDVFIHQCATPRNVAVELSRESHVSTSFTNPREAMKHKKLQYTFTSSHAGKWQHRLYGFCLALLWVWLLLTVASIAIAPRNLMVIGANIVVALLLWIPLIASWNSASRALGGHRFFFSVPLALLWRPIRNIIYYIKSHRAHSGQYAWQTLGPSANWSKLTDDTAK